jgi:hypothetical protein
MNEESIITIDPRFIKWTTSNTQQFAVYADNEFVGTYEAKTREDAAQAAFDQFIQTKEAAHG